MMFYRRLRVRRFSQAAAPSSPKPRGATAKAQQVLLPEGALGSRQLPAGLGESWVH